MRNRPRLKIRDDGNESQLNSSVTHPRNQFLVAQIGARRGYSVANALDRAGMLDRLYTDLCADLGLGWVLGKLDRSARIDGINRLQGRRIPAAVLGKTRSFSWPPVRYELGRRVFGTDPYRLRHELSLFGNKLGKAMARAGFGEATHLYTMLGDVTPLLQAARARGVITVTEIYCLLTADSIVELERKRYPGLEPDMPAELFELDCEWLKQVIALSDWLVVPSQAVEDDLVQNFGVSTDQCRIIPYAVGDGWFEIRNKPIPGQVLFVGTAGLRKGIHILAHAANQLGNAPYTYHIAGGVSDRIRTDPLMSKLDFLGRVPRLDISREYEVADVFVLPSLAEGSAEVTYEALASGIPVVTTAEAGSVVRDEIDGFLVPASDPVALAARVKLIVEDRELRERMAQAARERARDFTLAKYSNRLAAVLGSLPSSVGSCE